MFKKSYWFKSALYFCVPFITNCGILLLRSRTLPGSYPLFTNLHQAEDQINQIETVDLFSVKDQVEVGSCLVKKGSNDPGHQTVLRTKIKIWGVKLSRGTSLLTDGPGGWLSLCLAGSRQGCVWPGHRTTLKLVKTAWWPTKTLVVIKPGRERVQTIWRNGNISKDLREERWRAWSTHFTFLGYSRWYCVMMIVQNMIAQPRMDHLQTLAHVGGSISVLTFFLWGVIVLPGSTGMISSKFIYFLSILSYF